MKQYLIIATSCVLATTVFALSALDDASNYEGGWISGSNGGSGFNPWGFTATADNTATIADSTAAAGNVNSPSVSFEMAAANGGSFDVFRSFGGGASLGAGDTFSLDLSLNYRNGAKGFDLRNDGDTLFNFNVGGDTYFFGGVNLSDASGENWQYVANGVYSLEFELVTEVIMNAKIIRNSDTFGAEQYQIPNVALSGVVNNFKFYVSGTDNANPENRLYANNLQVVPEPAAFAWLLGVGVFLTVAVRRCR